MLVLDETFGINLIHKAWNDLPVIDKLIYLFFLGQTMAIITLIELLFLK